ncbi:hypothetical protein ES703_108722 [subsurface metagenome]
MPPLRLQETDNKYIAVNGVTIRYIVRGAGSPVLLLHGLGEFVESWAFNVESLSEHYLVYALDLPGHGLSEKPASGYSPLLVADFAIGFMQALRINRASLIGHSIGGFMSLSTAISFPEKVDKIVLVDSGGLSREMPLRFRLATLPILGEIMVKPTIKAGLRAGIKGAFYNPDLVTEEMVNMAYHYLKMPGAKRAMLSIIRNVTNLNGASPEAVVIDKLHLINAPTLLIHGAQDKAIPVEEVQNICKLIPKARLEVFEECGHVPHLEKPAEFNETVIAFLKTDQPLQTQFSPSLLKGRETKGVK